MAVRRFGPTLGAGVVIIETPPDRTLEPAPTGVTCYIGEVEKGATDELISCPGLSDYARKCGSYYDGSQVPDSAFDFFNLGQGAGPLFVVRVTDGTEVPGHDHVFSRHQGHAFYTGADASGGPWNNVKVPLLRATTKNGGRWGGRERTHDGEMDDESVDLTATTIDTKETFLEDEWAGGFVILDGADGTNYYKIESNDVAGVITTQSGRDMAADLAASADSTSTGYSLFLPQEEIEFPNEQAGTLKGVFLLWKDGEENEDTYFGLEIWENGAKVKDYPNLSMDPNNKWYINNVVNEDDSNFWVEFEVLYTGALDNDLRPANHYVYAEDWSSNVVTVPIAFIQSEVLAAPGTLRITNFTLPSANGMPDLVRPGRYRIECTDDSDGFEYTITTEIDYGVDAIDIPVVLAGTVPAPNQWMVGFDIEEVGAGPTIGDYVIVDVRPLPVRDVADGEGGLAGGRLYYDIETNKRAFAKIDANTVNTITLTTAPVPAPQESQSASQAGNVITTGTLTFPGQTITGPISMRHSTLGTAALNVTAGSPYADVATLVAAINLAWQTDTGSTGDIAVANGTDAIDISTDDSGLDEEVGYESFITVLANTDLGIASDTTVYGSLGATLRVQSPTYLRDGYNGLTPDTSRFLNVLKTDGSSLLDRLQKRNLGLVKLACPAITDTTIQKSGLAYAEYANYQYRVEFPATLDDDSSAVAYINDTIGRNDFGVSSYPSYGYVPNPTGAGTVLRTLTGTIHGKEALVAKNYQGYFKAAAGTDVVASNIVRLPTGERILNEEVLNPAGINIIKKVRGNFILWGSRTIALDPGWKWKHQREQMSHYENIFRDQFDFIIFAINDIQTQQSLITTFRAFFLPEWQKRALRGDTFEDAVSIKIDGDNNTNLTRANGDLFADIKLRLADTVERFNIRIGKAGIFEDLG